MTRRRSNERSNGSVVIFVVVVVEGRAARVSSLVVLDVLDVDLSLLLFVNLVRHKRVLIFHLLHTSRNFIIA